MKKRLNEHALSAILALAEYIQASSTNADSKLIEKYKRVPKWIREFANKWTKRNQKDIKKQIDDDPILKKVYG